MRRCDRLALEGRCGVMLRLTPTRELLEGRCGVMLRLTPTRELLEVDCPRCNFPWLVSKPNEQNYHCESCSTLTTSETSAVTHDLCRRELLESEYPEMLEARLGGGA